MHLVFGQKRILVFNLAIPFNQKYYDIPIGMESWSNLIDTISLLRYVYSKA